MSAVGIRHHVRHWREKWDLNADMVFTRHFRLGLCGQEWANPGDPVTPAMRKALGPQRLRTWWHARYIGLREWLVGVELPAPKVKPKRRHPVSQLAPVPEWARRTDVRVVPGKAWWYQVTLPDGTQRRVQGKAKLRELLDGI